MVETLRKCLVNLTRIIENDLPPVLSWMPKVNSYWCCVQSTLYKGARYAIIHYLCISLFCTIKPILFSVYHHEGITFLIYIQSFFVYAAALTGLVTFCLSLPVIYRLESRVIPEDALSLVFILFCLIFGIVDVIWGALSFIRAFIDPWLCEDPTETWHNGQENDRAIKAPRKVTCDAIMSAVYCLVQLYAFYPLICLKSFLTRQEEEQEEVQD